MHISGMSGRFLHTHVVDDALSLIMHEVITRQKKQSISRGLACAAKYVCCWKTNLRFESRAAGD